MLLAACALCGARVEGGIVLPWTAGQLAFSEPTQNVLASAVAEAGLPRGGAAASLPSADVQRSEEPRADRRPSGDAELPLELGLVPDSGARSGGASAPSRGPDDSSSGFAAAVTAERAVSVRASYRQRRGQSLRWSNPTPNKMLDPPKSAS